jgi:vitamin B12 transporter
VTGKRIRTNSRVFWRRHRDRWEMFREDDNWYRVENGMSISNDTMRTTYDTAFVYTNHHMNDVFGADLTLTAESLVGTTTLGWHLRSESINSTNIGYDRGIVLPVRGYSGVNYTLSDSRSNFNMHLEHSLALKKLYMCGGFMLNWNSYLPDEVHFFPGIDIRYGFTDNVLALFSYNYTMGVPTFTDLTYEDVNNQGNNTLKPYTQHSVEMGLRWKHGPINITAAGFMNRGHDVIDWVWFGNENKFSPINVETYTADGIEIMGELRSNRQTFAGKLIGNARFSYTYIDMRKDVPGNLLKYFNVRNKLAAMLQSNPWKPLLLAVNIRYTDRDGSYLTWDFRNTAYEPVKFEPYWLFDLRITYSWRTFSVFLEATNLFNVEYIDIGSIQQPGRWITGGLKFRIEEF